jgi:chorismate synthase
MPLELITAGESHGPGLTCIVEGLPAGLELDHEALDRDLARRQLGHGRGGRMKIERDRVTVTAGVRHGRTLGGPIALEVANRDYANWEERMNPWPVEAELAEVHLRSTDSPTCVTSSNAPALARRPHASPAAPWPKRS